MYLCGEEERDREDDLDLERERFLHDQSPLVRA